MTAIPCPHCDRTCAGPAGLNSHIRSLHPKHMSNTKTRTMNGGLVWEDPPARGRQSTILPAMLAAIPHLEARPNTWARVLTFTGKSSAGTARKQLADRPELAGIELSAHSKDGGSALYARWTGAA